MLDHSSQCNIHSNRRTESTLIFMDTIDSLQWKSIWCFWTVLQMDDNVYSLFVTCDLLCQTTIQTSIWQLNNNEISWWSTYCEAPGFITTTFVYYVSVYVFNTRREAYRKVAKGAYFVPTRFWNIIY